MWLKTYLKFSSLISLVDNPFIVPATLMQENANKMPISFGELGLNLPFVNFFRKTKKDNGMNPITAQDNIGIVSNFLSRMG